MKNKILNVNRLFIVILIFALLLNVPISLDMGDKGGLTVNAEGNKGVSMYAPLGSDIKLSDFSPKGNGAANDTAALKAAIDAGKEKETRIFLSKGVYLIDEYLAITSSVSLVFEEGASLKVGPNGTLNINSALIAGNYQIFEGEIKKGAVRVNTATSGNPFWFGAKGDGVTDDTEAFKRGYNVFNELALPFTEKGYVITTLETFENMSLTSATSKRATIIASAASDRLIYAPKGNFKVTHLRFEMGGTKDGTTVFYFDTRQYIEKVFINNCEFRDAYHVFSDAKADSWMMHMHFEDIECYDSRNSTYLIEDFEGFIFLKRFKIDNSKSFEKHKLTKGFPIIKIDDVRGTIFEDMAIIGGNSGFSEETGFLLPTTKPNVVIASVWWDTVKVTGTGGYGITIGATYICSLINTEVTKCGGGIKADSAINLQLDRVTVSDNTSPNAKATHGLELNNCEMTQITGLTAKNNQGSGIYLSGCKSTMTYKSVLSGNGGHGYRENGGSKNLFYDSECQDNKAGQASVSGNGGRVHGIVSAEGGEPQSFNGAGKID